jgi:KaiC/GvpD/RAD55 family RecA-like ATPase
LDELLGGLLPGRAYVVTGASGSGKSIACLQFLSSELERGARAALLTETEPHDVLDQAAFLGLRLEQSLRSGQFALLTYQTGFARDMASAPSSALALDELRHEIGPVPPQRLVIDSIGPFLDVRSSSGALIGALVQWAEALGATTFVTLPGELGGEFDLRLDPLIQRAHGIVRFAVSGTRRQIEIIKTRFEVPSTAPVAFKIERGLGITRVDPSIAVLRAKHA